MPTDILIIAEHDGVALKPVTHELVALSKRLSDNGRRSRTIAVLGRNLGGMCEDAACKTGVDILHIDSESMDVYNGELYLHHLESIVREMLPSLVLVSHTSQGMDYAPALAARLSAACITGVNGIRTDENGDVLYSRGICNGSFNTLIRPATALTVVTAQPGYFPAESWDGASGEVAVRRVTREPSAIRCTGIEKNPSSSSELGNARIIVSAGRGIGTQENLDVIRRFTACFPGAAVGGSRPLIDMGWMEYRHQVGITGAVVSPAVYIACGISGSTQHIAGMNTSGYVISINSDPNAAIFNVSDLCIVDDVIGFIEAFETVIREDA